MQINFIAQPQEQLGAFLNAALTDSLPNRVVLVSAFASLQAVLRLKRRLHEIHAAGAVVRVVVGVDMGGTSKEVLQELGAWSFQVFVFKNRKSGVTFHPKLYIVETPTMAEVFLGSNNLTDGGLYGNYEGAVRVSYQLPADNEELEKAKTQLKKFIEPALPVGRLLDAEYLEKLLARRDIPDEAEVRKRRKAARGELDGIPPDATTYGFETTPGPPRLPVDVQDVVMAAVRNQLDELDKAKRLLRKNRRAEERAAAQGHIAPGVAQPIPVDEQAPGFDLSSFTPLAQITPTAFYLELTDMSGNIPGEQRIPLEAINSAQDFWGWPDRYVKDVNPRKGASAGGVDRIYFNWKPTWRVRSVNNPANDLIVEVRMYFYQNSSDYRFHAGALKRWAQAGDMVRITKPEGEAYVYDCELAVAGTPEHGAWRTLCTAGSTHSTRLFGYS